MVSSISVLGATGSVGVQTLDAAERLGIPVRAMSGNRNIKLLEQLARRFMPEYVCVFDEDAGKQLKIALADTNIKVGSGMSALTDSACRYASCVVTAVSGSVGLIPTLAAIDEGRRIALANKETLVCGGEIVMNRAREKGAQIVPVDSEHSAIFQCLEAQGSARALRRILLTGSGGPFRGKSREETRNVTPAMAVSHPNWSMGAKISVDSATMMNKGLEFIEAMHLFNVTPDEIKVIIHPESIIHSMVEYKDGCVLAQLGIPDMALPIQYALTYPERADSPYTAPDFTALGKLTFLEPELEKTPCLALAMDCARRGGTAAAVMSAANEEAVALFLKEKLCFGAISDIVSDCVNKIAAAGTPTLEALREADAAARRFVKENCAGY
ncbi:MAG: 1-deoxy-D-xylulose-5-phosphate reductoisomerase [Oscillospiraceae bacterium]|nr:1-deoxy-D-xylulose-5-phosphate reductoisomerase [Oscillospiraceae bacterium]